MVKGNLIFWMISETKIDDSFRINNFLIALYVDQIEIQIEVISCFSLR